VHHRIQSNLARSLQTRLHFNGHKTSEYTWAEKHLQHVGLGEVPYCHWKDFLMRHNHTMLSLLSCPLLTRSPIDQFPVRSNCYSLLLFPSPAQHRPSSPASRSGCHASLWESSSRRVGTGSRWCCCWCISAVAKAVLPSLSLSIRVWRQTIDNATSSTTQSRTARYNGVRGTTGAL